MLNYIWNLPKGSKHLGGGWLARALLDNWTISGISWATSGNPAELALSISGQDAGNRMLGTYTDGNGAGLQPRFYRERLRARARRTRSIRPTSRCPGSATTGPTRATTFATPASRTTTCRSSRTSPSAANGRRTLQLRFEAFNVLNSAQFSGVNRTTNVTNAAGQTGAAIFNNYTGLTVTNNTRPAGSTAVQGTYFGEYTATRDPRIIQLGVKLYF